MSLDEAVAAAKAGELALLVSPERSAAEAAAGLGPGARVVEAAELALGDGPDGTVVVAHAEVLAGLVEDVWVGPWALGRWRERARPDAILLHTTHARADVVAATAEALGARPLGDPTTAAEAPDGEPTIDPAEVEAALADLTAGARVATGEDAWLLRDLACCGAIAAVWRVPFLLRVANDRRFKHPFVDDYPALAAFHDRYKAHVGGLGMLEAAEFRLHGRHDKDLRRFAEELDMPLLELARTFRELDRAGLVVSTPVEVGGGERPNLWIETGDAAVDPAEAAAGVARLRALRSVLDPAPGAEAAVERAPEATPDPMSALFASLESVEPVPEPEERPAREPAPPPPPAAPREEVPDHLPGLAALAAGDLQAARAELGGVGGEGADEAVLLGSFRYEVVDGNGALRRRFAIPPRIVAIALRALELEQVPAERARTALDADVPEAFVEVPRPGLIEVFFDGGELDGTHRLRELPGRGAFEEGRLRGARAAQAELAAGRATEADPGDPGWQALAEVLSARDAGEGLAAWDALERVDVDVETGSLRRSLVELLPEDHEERIALEARRAVEREERAARETREGLVLALRARGQEDEAGFRALELAEESGKLDELMTFLRQQAERNPRDPGPPLWIGRVLLRQGNLREAEASYFHAVYAVAGGARGVEWWFELVDRARADGLHGWMWGAFKRFLREEPDPRAMDRQLIGWLDGDLLDAEAVAELRKILGRFGGGRGFPQTWDRIRPEDEVDDWRSALQGLKLDE